MMQCFFVFGNLGHDDAQLVLWAQTYLSCWQHGPSRILLEMTVCTKANVQLCHGSR